MLVTTEETDDAYKITLWSDVMILKQIPVGELENFSYVIVDEATKLAAVVDPSGNVSRILDVVEREKLAVKYVINTHSHHDHVSGNALVASVTGAKIIMHSNSRAKKDIIVEDGDTINIGQTQIRVVHTPGHTQDSICLVADGALLTGDTLFVGECGRTDLPGGDSEDMYHSLFKKIAALDGRLRVYPGHNYGDKPYSTLSYEIDTNYTLKPRSKEEFILFMSEP